MNIKGVIIENGVVTGLASIADDEQGHEFAASQGWILVPDDSPVSIGWLYDGENFTAPPVVVVPVEAYQVDQERDRRTAMGFVYEGKAYLTESQSQMNDILGALADSTAAIAVDGAQPGDLRWADEERDFAWRAADDTRVPMDAQTCLTFTRAAVRRKTLLVGAGVLLKAMSPIPQDYMDDKYWPQLDSTVRAQAKAK